MFGLDDPVGVMLSYDRDHLRPRNTGKGQMPRLPMVSVTDIMQEIIHPVKA